ncbi:hypothetical protein D3C78_1351890 [compost metagenome]
MRQGVVDGGLDFTFERQHALAVLVLEAQLHIVLQHVGVPLGKGFFRAEIVQRFLVAGPAVAAALADLARRHRTHELGALGHAQRRGAPAADQRRVDQQHAARQLGVLGRGHHAEESAQRVAHQKHRFAPPVDFGAREVGELLHQVGPVVADGIAFLVAKAFHAPGLAATRMEQFEQ